MRTIEDMLPSLTKATLEGRITWEEEGVKYSTEVGGYKIQTWEWVEPDDGTSGFSVAIYMGNNQVDLVTADQFSSKHRFLGDFYAMARRSALNVEAVIDEIETELAKIPLGKKTSRPGSGG